MEPERLILEQKRNQKTPTTEMISMSPCYRGLTSGIAVGRQPTQNEHEHDEDEEDENDDDDKEDDDTDDDDTTNHDDDHLGSEDLVHQ